MRQSAHLLRMFALLASLSVLACGQQPATDPAPGDDDPKSAPEKSNTGKSDPEKIDLSDGFIKIGGDQPAPVALMADVQGKFHLTAHSSRYVSMEEGIDFGALPAGEFMPNMKFMSPLYSALLYLENKSAEEVVVDTLTFEGLSSDEPANPFSSCGYEFEPFALKGGKGLGIQICYHPEMEVPSSANAVIRSNTGMTIASFRVSGTGRALEPGEIPPMGLMADDPTPDLKGVGEIIVLNGRLIDFLTGADKTSTILEDVGIPQKEAATCLVDITGGGEIPNPAVSAVHPGTTAINTNNIGINTGVTGDEINVGQHVILDILITCPDGSSPNPAAVKWTIGGAHIKNYNDDIRSATLTEIPMTNPDLIITPRDLYWKKTGKHRVEAKVDYTWNGVAFTAHTQRDFEVERDALDTNRQMEDFYLWNHKARILKGHFAWHPANKTKACDSTGGRDFFEFHRQLLGSANGFRTTFGYPQIIYWDGTQALPVSPDSLHGNRTPRNIPFATPPWYTRFGKGIASSCPGIRAEKLADFTSAKMLADQMDGEWHGLGHANVGGTMSYFNSPKDPIFFRWHRAIDIVYHNWKIISGTP